jgi:hypothetical protein
MAKPPAIDAELLDLVQDYAQRTVDVICSDDVLREIPLLKTALVARDAVRSIRDEMTLKKMQDFFERLADVPQEDRQRMVAKLEADPGYRRRVGEHVVELLDRTDSHRKPAMLGDIFAALARGQIDVITFQRLVSAVERLPTHEIDTVRKFVDSRGHAPTRGFDRESIQALVAAGLADISSGGPGGGPLTYNSTRTGETFVTLDLDVRSLKR